MDSPGNPIQTPILFISGLELGCAVGEFAEAAVLPPLHWSSLCPGVPGGLSHKDASPKGQGPTLMA